MARIFIAVSEELDQVFSFEYTKEHGNPDTVKSKLFKVRDAGTPGWNESLEMAKEYLDAGDSVTIFPSSITLENARENPIPLLFAALKADGGYVPDRGWN